MPAHTRDDRIPVRFGPAAGAGAQEAVLAEGRRHAPAASAVARFAGAGVHPALCACCGGRHPAAAALGALFQDRARGRVPWFTAVVADVADPAAVAEALRSDLVAAARFRVPT
jgi:transposase